MQSKYADVVQILRVAEQNYPKTLGNTSSDDVLQLCNLTNRTTETASVLICIVSECSAMTEFADD